MKAILRKVNILDPNSSHYKKRRDIYINNGKIEKISYASLDVNKNIKEYRGKNLSVSPGWIDSFSFSGEPGNEQRETLASLANAAKKGGFTHVFISPETEPVIDSKSKISFIIKTGYDHGTHIIPYGALSVGCKGEDLAELMDMGQFGAIGFGDGMRPIESSELLSKGLNYAKTMDKVIFDHPAINSAGQMHEGITSTMLGLTGYPSVDEKIMIERDISLLSHFGGKLHLLNISGKSGLKLIEKAKNQGLNLTCSVPWMNLLFSDEDLKHFESNFKVLPPLRESKDRKALIKGVKEGIIDLITSNHCPIEVEQKNVEFPYAAFGAAGIDILVPILYTNEILNLEEIVNIFAIRPRKIFDIDSDTIEEGNSVNLTLFSEDKSSLTFNSLSNNYPIVEIESRLTILNTFLSNA